MALGDVIARLAAVLELDTAAFEKGATLAEKRMEQNRKKLEKIGKKMSGIGKTMSLAITAPLTAFGVSAFNAASDAAELQQSFDQTFGSMSAAMNKWAEDTGNAMGRSTQEMQKAANTFGIFFNAAGATDEKAAEMSQTFSKLAQDLGSFYNVDTDTAIEKLRSGLSGESEPMRDFGVFLNEAAVKAKAMELGLTGVGNELTDQEKILARYAIIMEQTTNAQGDVARTSQGTANQMRASKAAFEELQVVVGTKLLPVLTPLIEKLGKAIEWFTKLPTPVQDTALVVAALSAVFGPVLVVVGNLLPLLTKLGPVINVVRAAMLLLAANPIILGLAAVIGGVYLAWKNWDKIEPIVRNLYTAVKMWVLDKLNAVWDSVKAKIDFVKGLFFGLYDAVVGHSYIPDMVDGIARHMARLQEAMVDPAQRAATSTAEAMRKMASDVNTLLERLFPASAALRQFREEMALLEKAKGAGTLDQGTFETARRALEMEYMSGGQAKGSPDFLKDVKPLTDGMGDVSDAITKMGEKAKVTTVAVAKSFKDMADATVQSLQNLASSIKGGGFLDILSSVFGVVTQLGSIGAFGKSFAARINAPKIPGNADGTNNWPGGLSWVGERGPELVNLPRGSQVIPNHELGRVGRGGTASVQIVPSPYFNVVVDGRIQQAAGPIMIGGADVAQARSQRSQSRRVA
jgi:hypothetical protein